MILSAARLNIPIPAVLFFDQRSGNVNLQEGPLTSSDEFYDFRKRASELVEDLVFCVGDLQVFNDLGAQIMRNDSSWYAQEAALYLLHAVSRTVDP